MDPLSVGLLSGGANLLGSIFSSTTSASNTAGQIAAQQAMQGQAEQFNAGQAQLQRDYQTNMSNTAYQRASIDMQKAGLNPMMMFSSGSAASTPSGGSASIGTPNVPMPQKTSPLAGLGPSVSQAINSAVEAKTFDRLTQEIANMRTQQQLTGAQKVTEDERPGLVDAERKAMLERAEDIRQSAAQRRQDQILKGPATEESAGVLDLPDSWLRGVGRVKYGVGSFGDIAAPIVSTATAAGRIAQTFKDLNKSGMRTGTSRTTYGKGWEQRDFEDWSQ